MRFVPAINVDLTSCLDAGTKGEGTATVDLGASACLRAKVEAEEKSAGALE